MVPDSSGPSLTDSALQDAAPLKRAVRRGASAMGLVQVVSQLISLGGLAILMRLLTPLDYGLLGMVMPIVMFFRIFSALGLNMATSQRRELTHEEITPLFWMNVMLGVATAIVTAAIAPMLGRLYGNDALTLPLQQLGYALAGTAVIAALGVQHQALMERNLRFPRLGAMRLVAQGTAIMVAIAAAAGGWGVWTLVVHQYVELVLLAGLAWWLVPWRPGRPTRLIAVWPMIRFGAYFAAASVLLFVADHAGRILVGRLVGPEAVGYYSQAYQLMIKPVYLITTPLSALVVAGLARAGGSTQTQQELLVAFYRLLGNALFPTCVGLALVAGDVMQVIGGDQWRPAGVALSVLSIGMFAHGVIILGGYVLTAAGRTDRLLAAAVATVLTMLVGYLGGWLIGRDYGQPMIGIAAGHTVAISLLCLPHAWFCVAVTGHELRVVIARWFVPLRAALVMGMFVWMFGQWLQGTSATLRLLVLVPLGVITYATLAREEIQWLTGQLRAESST